MEATRTKKWQILSGSALKIMAMVTMLIDHVACYLLSHEDVFTQTLFTLSDTRVSWYYILRSIGRLAFPLYVFLLTEGFIHTRNRLRYGVNLFLFALISELPWNFVHSGTWVYQSQNVFFTLFFGYVALCLIESEKLPTAARLASVLSLFVLAYFFKADYGYAGIATVLAMYLLRARPVARVAVCTCLFSATWRAGLAFVPISLYSGERGFIKGRIGKYACYVFYPLHLLLLGLVRYGFFS